MEQDFYKFAKEMSLPLEISLTPDKLNKNYRDNIIKSLVERYEGQCIPKLGYIIKILKTGNIISDVIGSMTPNAIIVVQVVVLIFLPIESMRLTVNIDIIFNHGIFAHRDKIRILIPITSLNDWVIHNDFTQHKLIHKNTGQILRKGDTITIELKEVRFEKDGYSCIGNLCK